MLSFSVQVFAVFVTLGLFSALPLSTWALQQASSNKKLASNRRSFLAKTASTVIATSSITTTTAPVAVSAATTTTTTTTITTTTTDPSVLLGTYTDPVSHPGGTRTIALTGTGFGGFQLAKVTGGGGQGEPASFELNAMISPCPGGRQVAPAAEWCITIDFTPKGGPADFGGYWDEQAKGIRFPADGNFWPKQ